MMHQLVYKVGEYYRNSKIQKHFSSLKKTDTLSIDHLQELQIVQLRKLLHHAQANSPFYKKSLEGIDINNFTLAMLPSLPQLSKADLRNNLKNIQNRCNGKMFLSSTSGSTGNALIFERNEDWDASHRAAQLRGYSWYGINPWAKNLYFWGFNPSFMKKMKIRLMDTLVNRYRIFNYDDESIKKAEQIIKQSEYIEGYSSSIFTLAQHLKSKNISFDNIKLVKGTSEKIFDYYHKTVKAVFGKKMVSEYGAAETGIIAFECPEGNMHITMENVIVEEVDNKILLTNLFSYSLPIIRYELGDYISLNTSKKCSCGRAHHIIDEITGRIGENIQGYKKTYLSLTLYYVFKNISLEKKLELAYFACQQEKGKILIKILADSMDNVNVENYVNIELKKYFENDLDVEIIFVEKLEMLGKKSQSFISYIDAQDKKQCS